MVLCIFIYRTSAKSRLVYCLIYLFFACVIYYSFVTSYKICSVDIIACYQNQRVPKVTSHSMFKNAKTVSSNFCATLYMSQTSLPYPRNDQMSFFPAHPRHKPVSVWKKTSSALLKHCKQSMLFINIQVIMIWR